MIRIGVVNIDVSHPLAFSEILLRENRARYAAVYNDGFRGDDEVGAFIEKRGLERRCATVEELAECVDIGFVQGCNWDKHIRYAMPFIERGKPVFIDKPVAGNLRDLNRLVELSRQGAVILGSSSLRYAEEIASFVNRPASERGEVVNVFGTCGIDEFNYGIHVVESICALIDSPAKAVRYAGAGSVGGTLCESYTVSFESGATATYHTMNGPWMPCWFLVTTTKGVTHVDVDVSKVYKSMLDRICDTMETGVNRLATVEALCHAVKIMLAGRLSKLNGGAAFALSDIPEDDPGYDGALFEAGYAAAARKIYLG
jgi:predicted dehydrogenase